MDFRPIIHHFVHIFLCLCIVWKLGRLKGEKSWIRNYILCQFTTTYILSSGSRSLYRIARFPLVSLLSITWLIFLLYGSLKGKRRKSIFRAAIAYCCVSTPWRNSRPAARLLRNMQRAERYFAETVGALFQSESSRGNQSYGFRYRHRVETPYACEREYTARAHVCTACFRR